jgi:ribosomal protein L22
MENINKKHELKEKEEKIEEKKEEKHTEKKEEKKKEIIKKDSAIVRGNNLPISEKFSSALCKMIRRKEIDEAIRITEEVLKFKRAIPMNNMEIAHKKGKGMMAGRYPQKVCKEFIVLLKQLKANSSVNGIGIPIIWLAKADKASSPFRREGRRAKRANIYLEAREKLNSNKKKK